MFHLGGHAINLSSQDLQISRGETIEDTAKTLSRYVDVVMARVYDHSTVETIAKSATIPVINGLSNSYHPCQILADLMTIKEKKGKLDGLSLAWIGDGNNVCNSMMIGCSKVGISMSIATPKEFEPNQTLVKTCKKLINIDLSQDPQKAAKNADIIVTDTFVSIHDNPKRIKKFLPKYQVNPSLMSKAKNSCIFMHSGMRKEANPYLSKKPTFAWRWGKGFSSTNPQIKAMPAKARREQPQKGRFMPPRVYKKPPTRGPAAKPSISMAEMKPMLSPLRSTGDSSMMKADRAGQIIPALPHAAGG